ncbi:uncharacterized protein MYCFIDRAFT_177542 [Pseudocercospora fijiensis CIRAD86]|uniref:NTF2-like domain-containing protein n=1 Tax=Pseudocercospora fijiensis (strain CIRAD86) TaxID=383855 RepID=M3A7M0_PSEFD|nr:uncharacterized protein MYCFIDRAFT_177542 [Pseudocercospora fijiensis CIRAD86]EME80611.1 hypothetical protein MYCFIDRAFT_177542 [Pseudocercospora fijiensis CIRAD86]
MLPHLLLLLPTLFTNTLANPCGPLSSSCPCLNSPEASNIALRWLQIFQTDSLGNGTGFALIDSTISENFTYYDEGASFGDPAPVYPNKAALENSISGEGYSGNLVTDVKYSVLETFESCETIGLRWRSEASSARGENVEGLGGESETVPVGTKCDFVFGFGEALKGRAGIGEMLMGDGKISVWKYESTRHLLTSERLESLRMVLRDLERMCKWTRMVREIFDQKNDEVPSSFLFNACTPIYTGERCTTFGDYTLLSYDHRRNHDLHKHQSFYRERLDIYERYKPSARSTAPFRTEYVVGSASLIQGIEHLFTQVALTSLRYSVRRPLASEFLPDPRGSLTAQIRKSAHSRLSHSLWLAFGVLSRDKEFVSSLIAVSIKSTATKAIVFHSSVIDVSIKGIATMVIVFHISVMAWNAALGPPRSVFLINQPLPLPMSTSANQSSHNDSTTQLLPTITSTNKIDNAKSEMAEPQTDFIANTAREFGIDTNLPTSWKTAQQDWRTSRIKTELHSQLQSSTPKGGWQISKAVCMALGSLNNRISLEQLALFMDMDVSPSNSSPKIRDSLTQTSNSSTPSRMIRRGVFSFVPLWPSLHVGKAAGEIDNACRWHLSRIRDKLYPIMDTRPLTAYEESIREQVVLQVTQVLELKNDFTEITVHCRPEEEEKRFVGLWELSAFVENEQNLTGIPDEVTDSDLIDIEEDTEVCACCRPPPVESTVDAHLETNTVWNPQAVARLVSNFINSHRAGHGEFLVNLSTFITAPRSFSHSYVQFNRFLTVSIFQRPAISDFHLGYIDLESHSWADFILY